MLILPVKHKDGDRYTVYVIIEMENLLRMQRADPLEFDPAEFGEPWTSLKLAGITVCYEDAVGVKGLMDLKNAGAPLTDVIKYLLRGYSFISDAGDGDGRYNRWI